MFWKNRNGLSEVHASAPHNLDIVWLISWKMLINDILFQSISKMEVQPHFDDSPRTT
jgi:hypothetical protein